MKKKARVVSILTALGMLVSFGALGWPPPECVSTKAIACEHDCRRDTWGGGKSCIKDIHTPSQSWCELTGSSPNDCESGTGGTNWDCHCSFEGGF